MRNRFLYVSRNVGIGTIRPIQKFQIGSVGSSGEGNVFVVTSDSEVGIGTTTPISKLDVRGDAYITGIITASSFAGNASSATFATNAGIATFATNAGVSTYATNAGISTNLNGGLTGNIPYQSGTNSTAFLANGGSGTILQSNGVGNAPTWVTPAAAAGAITGLTIRDENNIVSGLNSVSTLNFVGSIVSVASTAGIATITFLDYVSNAGIATYATNAGIATYATNAGIATFATNAGIATFATNAGIATYTSEWTLGANESSNYTFTGPGLIGAENDPVLYLVRGQQYKFTNTMGAHPFRIQSTVNGSTGTQYNDGITNNDVSNGTLTWNVQFDAPNILYYQCTAHGSMGGKIYIIDAGIGPDISINTSGIITASAFFGNGINITGIATITSASGTVKIGIGTTALLVEGNARVTGILTVGSSSITLNGITDTINVGTGLTLSSSGINVSGVITAMAIKIGETTVIDNSRNINAGIATFTRLDVPPIPITFSPAIGATSVDTTSNIIITFNGTVAKGTGNITLRANSANGTAFSTIGVSSSSVTISGGAVTIDPPENIGFAVTTFVVVDAGAFSGLTTTFLSAPINTYSFTTSPLSLSSIVPANAATNVGIGTNITLTFPVPPTRGTGTITLRSGSTSGSVIETFDAASSGRISISGNVYTIDPTSDLVEATSIHTIIPSTAITGYVGLNTTGADTHSFQTAAPAVGASYEGGFLICKSSPVRWVVSPYSAEVSRTWYCRGDANTRAQQVSGCTGWFIPTESQLQNPGFICRSFWGPSPCYSSACYWTSTSAYPNYAALVQFSNGLLYGGPKSLTRCVRAFRCVTY